MKLQQINYTENCRNHNSKKAYLFRDINEVSAKNDQEKYISNEN